MTPASEKQKNYILVLAKERFGLTSRDYINGRVGKAMGLSMRERSSAGKLGPYLDDLSSADASTIISSLKGE